MSGDQVGPVDEPVGKLRPRVWFDRCTRLLFLAAIVWALVATFWFYAPFVGFNVSFLVLIVGLLFRPTRALAFLAFLFLLFALALPMREGVRAPVRSAVCRSHMKQVVLALRNYHDDYGCFPPAYLADEDGQPMHSWRVLILPYLEEEDLYEQYRFDEPWNGPSNSRLADEFARGFQCFQYHSGRSATSTNYLLITGDGTAWADGRAPTRDDFTDGTANTIILAETADSNISWMEPRDLTLEEAMRGINRVSGIGISSWHPAKGRYKGQGSANVAFADGAVVNLKNDFPLDELEELLTYQGGEAVERPDQRNRN